MFCRKCLFGNNSSKFFIPLGWIHITDEENCIFSQRDVGIIGQRCLPVGNLFHPSTALVLHKSDFMFDCRVKFHSP